MSRWMHARFLVAILAASAVLGTIWLVPGSASVPAKKPSQSDCEALQALGEEIPEVSGSGRNLFGKEAAAVEKGLEATAKKIRDKKLRSALNTLAAIYDDLADADSASEAVAITLKGGEKYAKALATVGKATLQCLGSQITLPSVPPSLTLPTLPGNVTLPSLPGNVTLPTLPR